MKYHALTVDELIAHTNGCSPMGSSKGYVAGPDINGRYCHVATCHSMHDAIQRAKQLNEEFPDAKLPRQVPPRHA